MKHTLTAVALVAALGGCASTPQGMRGDPESRDEFTVEENYQLVLQRMVTWGKECKGRNPMPFGQDIEDVEHYPDLRVASISRGGHFITTQIVQVIDIKETEPGKTRVTVHAKGPLKERVFRMQRLVANGDTSCP